MARLPLRRGLSLAAALLASPALSSQVADEVPSVEAPLAAFEIDAAFAPSGAAEGLVAFVDIDANVGGASGGHSALLVGDTVAHFQRHPDGTLRLAREPWASFAYVYAGLQNRALHLARLDVPQQTADALLGSLARQHVEQQDDLRRRDEAALDLAWLRAARGEEPWPPLRALGLVEVAGSSSLTLGEDLTSLREALQLEAALAPEARADPAVLLELDVPLAPAEIDALAGYALELDGRIDALQASVRPDRGEALLVAIARRDALRLSLATGRLVVVDPFPDDALVLPAGRAFRDPVAARALADRAREVFGLVRARSLAGLDERAYGLLEESAARWREIERGLQGEPVRLAAGRLVPSRGRPRPVAVTSPPEPLLVEARARLAEHERVVAERYRYALFQDNCVTGLADVARDELFPERGAPGGGLGFIPRVFFAQVLDELPVEARGELPNHRHAVAEPEWLAPGSSIYRPLPRDGSFLLFTDDLRLLRPLAGVANLAWGAAHALAGLVSWPADGGQLLRSGVSGAFYSLPELAFFNVRKGSFEYVPPGVAGRLTWVDRR